MTAARARTLVDALVHAGGLAGLPPTALAAARDALAPPSIRVVVGRTGVGKSSLIRALTGARVPVGLGGVTRAAAPYLHRGVTWVDTAGLDGVDAGIAALRPLLAAADGVVWVVDGLQPVARSARAVVEAVREPGVDLRLLVARADLVPAEEQRTLRRRVDAVARALDATVLGLADLRGPLDASVSEALRAEPGSLSPTRRRRLSQAVGTVAAAIADHPGPPDPLRGPPAAHAAWRGLVGELHGQVPSQDDDGLAHALATLPDRLEGRLRSDPTAAALVHALGPPRIPTVAPPPARDLLAQVVSGRAGRDRAWRAVLHDALAEGDAALHAWLGAGRGLVDRARRDPIDDARAALSGLRDILSEPTP